MSQKDFNQFNSGISSSPIIEYQRIVGDIHSEPGILQSNQALKDYNIQGTTKVTRQVYSILKVSDTLTYFFVKNGSNTQVLKAGTTTPVGTITGIVRNTILYNGNIFIIQNGASGGANKTYLDRWQIPSDFTTYLPKWQELADGHTDYNDMHITGGNLYLGNKNFISVVANERITRVDDDVWNGDYDSNIEYKIGDIVYDRPNTKIYIAIDTVTLDTTIPLTNQRYWREITGVSSNIDTIQSVFIRNGLVVFNFNVNVPTQSYENDVNIISVISTDSKFIKANTRIPGTTVGSIGAGSVSRFLVGDQESNRYLLIADDGTSGFYHTFKYRKSSNDFESLSGVSVNLPTGTVSANRSISNAYFLTDKRTINGTEVEREVIIFRTSDAGIRLNIGTYNGPSTGMNPGSAYNWQEAMFGDNPNPDFRIGNYFYKRENSGRISRYTINLDIQRGTNSIPQYSTSEGFVKDDNFDAPPPSNEHTQTTRFMGIRNVIWAIRTINNQDLYTVGIIKHNTIEWSTQEKVIGKSDYISRYDSTSSTTTIKPLSQVAMVDDGVFVSLAIRTTGGVNTGYFFRNDIKNFNTSNNNFLGENINLNESYDTYDYNKEDLDLRIEHEVSSISNYEGYLIVGSKDISFESNAIVYSWDRQSNSWNFEDSVNVERINAIKNYDNYLIIQAGDKGEIFQYYNGKVHQLKKIPNLENVNIDFKKVVYFRNRMMFAIDGEGIYSIGRHTQNYNLTVAVEYDLRVLQEKLESETTYNGRDVRIEVLEMKVVTNNNMLIACKIIGTLRTDNNDVVTNYNVFEIDLENKANAVAETNVIHFNDNAVTSINAFYVSVIQSLSSASVTAQQIINGNPQTIKLTKLPESKNMHSSNELNPVTHCSFRVTLKPDGNDSLKLDQFSLNYG